MKTFPAIFKSVYDEALLDLGFKRAKGRHLYYIRMVGDEIAHIITYTNEWASGLADKAFVVRGGVATVYRKRLTFDQSPKANKDWLSTNSKLYAASRPQEKDGEYQKKISEFGYNSDNEFLMKRVVCNSLEATKQIMLPILDEVQDLRKYLEFVRDYNIWTSNIYPDEYLGKKNCEYDYNEGILYFKEYSIEEFVREKNRQFNEIKKKWEYMMKNGLTGMSQEKLEVFMLDIEEGINEEIEDFKDLANDSDKMAKLNAELERRKKQNTELLNSLI